MASISSGGSIQAVTEAEQGTAGSSAGHKRTRRHALFGNYSGYYGKRRLVSSDEPHPDDAWHDVRLPVLSQCATVRQHCRNAHWLDVGCNDAQFSLLLAAEFETSSLLGVDIDQKLVDRAHANLASITACPDAWIYTQGRIQPKLHQEQHETNRKESCGSQGRTKDLALKLCDKIDFVRANVVHDELGANLRDQFDVISCFSVTKWIQLNWGDAGLNKLFVRLHGLLRAGGILLLEPQPWKSYKRRRHLSAVVSRNYKSIELRPAGFVGVLQELGFELLETLRPEVGNNGKGFQRPIHVLRKR